ncbi:MAG: adenosylhomocysteinase [Acidimicrobiia bacterium]|nr:adenosylhomocysteinase [Acidimicrobiia bacterium]
MGEQAMDGRMGFVSDHMPILRAIARRFSEERPFEGLTIAVRIHVEPKTGVLIRALVGGGARVVAMGNKGTTDDLLAGYLRNLGIEVFGSRADDDVTIASNLHRLVAERPDLALDNGAEMIELLVEDNQSPLGATEETTSGAITLRGSLRGRVPFPVLVINDSPLKAIVENKHGVGQSVVESIRSATNLLLHRRRLVVLGYGWCGRGIAQYGRAAGADIVVIEPDSIKALEAAIDGYAVSTMEEEASLGDLFVSATGHAHVISVEDMERMKPNAVLANAGHFDNEIDVEGLRKVAVPSDRGADITRYRFASGGSIDVVAQGRMVNLAVTGSRGNSIEIMDLGFSLQALCLERLAIDPASCSVGDQPVPADIDDWVARAMVAELR